MKSPFVSLCLVAAALLPPATSRAQSGTLLKTFDVRAGRLLLDPARPRLYATLPLENALAVIDTDRNTVVTTLALGAKPVDLALSPDGTRLYIANAGPIAQSINVVDLTTLTTQPSLPAPFSPAAIVTGLADRLYVVPTNFYYVGGYALPSFAQINATSGVVEVAFGGASFYGGYLAITPDRKTLFYGDRGVDASTLVSFDVSAAVPGPQRNAPRQSTGGDGEGLTVSHNGKFLVYPNGSGNQYQLQNIFYTTTLIPTTDLGGALGYFRTGAYPGIAVFSGDDNFLYQVQFQGGGAGQNVIRVFSTKSTAQTDAFLDPNPKGRGAYPLTITGLALAEASGGLYIAGTDGSFGNPPDRLELVRILPTSFFAGAVALSGGFYYLKFSNGVPFGYYNLDLAPYLYHVDLGFEYLIDAADGRQGIYLYDFTSGTFWYTSSGLFPYLYDFSLNTFLYYYPTRANPTATTRTACVTSTIIPRTRSSRSEDPVRRAGGRRQVPKNRSPASPRPGTM